MEKDAENKNEVQEVQKEVFELMEVNVTDVNVEKGYATSVQNDPISIQQWEEGTW